MTDSKDPILPGTTVTVNNQESIYNGYEGFVQRISGDKAAVLFEGGKMLESLFVAQNCFLSLQTVD